MVNANVVISVSAILVAVILTIVFVLRAQGAKQTDFSLSVSGKINEADAGMYYCIGDACQFYQDLPAGVPTNFPGYFALVGFVAEGSTYLTEHSIGKTFKFTNGALVSCFDATPLNSGELSAQVAGLKAAYKGDGTYTIDGDVFTLGDYSFSEDPASDSPRVLGYSVPSIDECKAVWFVEGVDHDDISDFGAEQGFNGNAVSPVHARHLSGERMLWDLSKANVKDSAWARNAAGAAYDGVSPANSYVWNSCVTNTVIGGVSVGSAVARFIYDNTGTTMAIAFAGSNDAWDFVLDLVQIGNGNPSDLHWGFWKYVDLVQGCTNSYVNQLWGWDIDIDMLVGHSLGGAAAVVYKRMYGGNLGVRNAVVDTWAGPKTTKGTQCRYPGNRRFDEKDPVSGNGMGLMGSLSHDVQNAQRGSQGSECSDSVWGVCYSWRTTYNTGGAACTDVSGGCSWLADCVYNVGRHALSNYAKYNF